VDAVAATTPGMNVTPSDLAELMAAFNDVTGRLQTTHETLHSEVVRLKNELRQANEQLQRSKRLAALGEMAAGIAHEVRNPLGSIQLYAGLLEKDLTDRPPLRDTAVKIGTAVRRLDEVVGDVLVFAREIRARRAAADAGELLDRALESCVPERAGKHAVAVRRADLERTAAGVIGAAVELDCDHGLVCQALVNLVRNALEAMAEAPAAAGAGEHRLTLDAQRRTLRDGDGAQSCAVVLSVADTGPGVSPEVMDRMFNPFFTTRATGTGLGLAIVHRIMDAHGGSVVVRNNAALNGVDQAAARGATIELVFPVAIPAAHAGGRLEITIDKRALDGTLERRRA
jgi:signal transduction histidine kinase